MARNLGSVSVDVTHRSARGGTPRFVGQVYVGTRQFANGRAMQNPANSSLVFRPLPPPLWFVTNGELTVGPVTTSLLIRGVEHGRVPDECDVAGYDGQWRNVHCVREIAALGNKMGPKAPTEEQLIEWTRPS